jgi:GxxExxY protein
MNKQERDPLTEKIIANCFYVHRELGPGFPEKIYGKALAMLFIENGLKCEVEKEFTVTFKEKVIGKFRCDFLINDKVIAELKAVNGRLPIIFEYQLLSYLKASGINVGLLINFGNKSCEIRRLMY